MDTYKYACLNDECDNNGFQFIIKSASQLNQKEYCETCGCPIKLMGQVVYGNIGGKFIGSTPVERKQMLLKRSKEHFNNSGLADRKRSLEKIMRSQIKDQF